MQAAEEEAASGVPSPALAPLVADYSTKLGRVYWDLDGAFRAQKQYACAHFLAAAAVPGAHQVDCFTHLGHYYRWARALGTQAGGGPAQPKWPQAQRSRPQLREAHAPPALPTRPPHAHAASYSKAWVRPLDMPTAPPFSCRRRPLHPPRPRPRPTRRRRRDVAGDAPRARKCYQRAVAADPARASAAGLALCDLLAAAGGAGGGAAALEKLCSEITRRAPEVGGRGGGVVGQGARGAGRPCTHRRTSAPLPCAESHAAAAAAACQLARLTAPPPSLRRPAGPGGAWRRRGCALAATWRALWRRTSARSSSRCGPRAGGPGLGAVLPAAPALRPRPLWRCPYSAPPPPTHSAGPSTLHTLPTLHPPCPPSTHPAPPPHPAPHLARPAPPRSNPTLRCGRAWAPPTRG
jgi:hypothetical protein